MADISLCKGTDCPRKEQCLRFTQPPLPKYQAYLIMCVSVPNPAKECRFFWDNSEINP